VSVVARAQGAWLRVVGFVEAREDPISLALCRIAICSAVFVHIARSLFIGAAQLAWIDADDKKLGGLGVHPGFLFDAIGAGLSERNVVAMSVVCATAALFGALGLFTRASLVVMWLTFRNLVLIAVDARSAYDVLIPNIAFVLILSGCGRALSIDAALWRLRRGTDPPASGVANGDVVPRTATRWPRILLVVQIGFLYFGSAIMKASSGWIPGGDASALWFILHQPLWARFADWPLALYPLTQVATTIVWCFEALGLVFVLAVIVREAPSSSRLKRSLVGRVLERVRFRELYLVVGVAMHLGIEATMEVGAFTAASLSLYFCAIAPSEWRRFFSYIRSACSRSLSGRSGYPRSS
jgi:hypothetical protein